MKKTKWKRNLKAEDVKVPDTAETTSQRMRANVAGIAPRLNALTDGMEFPSMEDLIGSYLANPCPQTGVEMSTGIMISASHTGRSAFGPMLGILEVLQERKHGTIEQIRETLKEHQPGWNDYYITRWMLTGEHSAMEELHRRACHLMTADRFMTDYQRIGKQPSISDETNSLLDPWYFVVNTARWAIASLCGQRQDFLDAYEAVEDSCQLCASGDGMKRIVLRGERYNNSTGEWLD